MNPTQLSQPPQTFSDPLPPALSAVAVVGGWHFAQAEIQMVKHRNMGV